MVSRTASEPGRSLNRFLLRSGREAMTSTRSFFCFKNERRHASAVAISSNPGFSLTAMRIFRLEPTNWSISFCSCITIKIYKIYSTYPKAPTVSMCAAELVSLCVYATAPPSNSLTLQFINSRENGLFFVVFTLTLTSITSRVSSL